MFSRPDVLTRYFDDQMFMGYFDLVQLYLLGMNEPSLRSTASDVNKLSQVANNVSMITIYLGRVTIADQYANLFAVYICKSY